MRNRGAVGAKGVDSGHGEILEFFAYKHVGNCWGNCKRRRREAAIAKGKKLLPTRGSEERRRKLPQLGMGRSPRIREHCIRQKIKRQKIKRHKIKTQKINAYIFKV